jgi:hypothetical protein
MSSGILDDEVLHDAKRKSFEMIKKTILPKELLDKYDITIKEGKVNFKLKENKIET